jgi:hypothetical protein
MPEARKHVRGQTNDYFIVYNSDTGAPIGRLRNLTAEGAMLISGDPIAAATKVQCQLALPRPINNTREIYFTIEIRWCRENIHAGWYEVGCLFEAIPDLSKAVLDVLVRDWMTFDSEVNAGPVRVKR